MKKKILFLVPLPPPLYGAAVSSKLILESDVLNREFDIKHIKLNYSENVEDVGKINLKKIFRFFFTGFKIFGKILSFRPNIIYFTIAPIGSGFLRDSFYVMICKTFRKKILFHIRGRGIQEEMQNKIKNKWYRKVFKNTKSIILGDVLYDDIRAIVRKKDVFVLPNAIKNEISDKEFNSIIKKKYRKKNIDLLFLSNLDETKGPMILLKACKILKDRKLNFTCNFAGAWTDYKFKEKFIKYINNNKLSKNIKIHGLVTGKRKKTLLENSDILAFPTYYKLETFGLVIIEAMQYGIPVIANGIATIPSIIKNEETGFVLQKNTPEEITKKLEYLIKSKTKRINMGKKARKRFLDNYNFSKYEHKIRNVFNQNIK